MTDALSDRQRELVAAWLPGGSVVRDHAWGLLEGAVLEVTTPRGRAVVKTGGPTNGHIPREITAHESGVTAPLVALGAAARLIAADRDADVLATEWLDGDLVEGTPAATDPDVHRRAGELLRVLHGRDGAVDADWGRRRIVRTLAALEAPHRIPADRVDAARRILAAARPGPEVLVPTHGDWQPRNWLLDGDRVRVIDWGRFDRRPAATDLEFLDSRAWRDRPDLEAAFLEGYGDDPRDGAWPLQRLHQALGTAVWAYGVGDTAFETEGHELLERALARF